MAESGERLAEVDRHREPDLGIGRAALFVKLRRMPRPALFLFSVSVAVVLTQVLAAALSMLFHGELRTTVLVMGFLISVAVSAVVGTAFIYVIAEMDRVALAYEELAHRDSLTGVLNRRMYDRIVRKEVSRARRHGHDLALLALDVDHFKHVNDDQGHATGDHLLRDLALVIARLLRDSDYLFRIGGDELLVLAPETDLLSAENLAIRLRKKIDGLEQGPAARATVSIGVAALSGEMDQDQLFAAADGALYLAKRAGRNVVRVAGR